MKRPLLAIAFVAGFATAVACATLVALIGNDTIAAEPHPADPGALLAGHDSSDTAAPQEQDKELAPYMTSMQVFSQKLGYAVRARNQPLAEFYVQELKEGAMEIINDIPVYEGMPIDQYLYHMFYPTFEPLADSLAAEDWDAADSHYVTLINACNACHATSRHPFIQITPASGAPPFNQQF